MRSAIRTIPAGADLIDKGGKPCKLAPPRTATPATPTKYIVNISTLVGFHHLLILVPGSCSAVQQSVLDSKFLHP